MPEVSNPHDRFFKDVFSRPDVARDFVLNYLPAEVVGCLAPATLRPRKDSFVDAHLREHFSDLLYQVEFTDGRRGFIYVLFEHKSHPDALVAIQLLRYLVRIWDESLRQEGELPPVVIPVVVYHGLQRWTVELNCGGLFPGPEALRPYWPEFRYELCDLSSYRDEEIRGHVLLQVGLLVLKYIYQGELAERLPGIFSLLRQLADQHTATEFLYTLVRYLFYAGGQLTRDDLHEALVTAYPVTGAALMNTIAAQLWEQAREEGKQEGRQEGKQEGRQEGKQEGRQEGKQEGRQEVLIDAIGLVLRLKFGAESAPVLSEIRAISDVERLKRILDALEAAQSLDEIRSLYQ